MKNFFSSKPFAAWCFLPRQSLRSFVRESGILKAPELPVFVQESVEEEPHAVRSARRAAAASPGLSCAADRAPCEGVSHTTCAC